MWIHVKTVGTLKSLEEGTRFIALEVPEGTPVSSIIQQLQLKEWEIGFILINQIRRSPEEVLHDRDELTFVAPLAGG
jgi:hypothetical protein